jgi:hypothetical protein
MQMQALFEAALGGDAAPAAAVAVPGAAAPVMAVVVPLPPGVLEHKLEDAVPAIISIGCKLDVWKGRAVQTKGGLMKQHLKLNRIGTVVSIKGSDAAKRNKNLGHFQCPVNP